MAKPKILTGPEAGKESASGRVRKVGPSEAWTALGVIGLAFLLVGGSDFALTWYPFDFGNREWEFGTVTQSFNGLPVPILGVGLMLVASTYNDRRWMSGLSFAVALLLLLWMLAAIVLWATLQGTPVEVLTGMKKALARTTMQSLVYPVLLGFFAQRAFAATWGTKPKEEQPTGE